MEDIHKLIHQLALMNNNKTFVIYVHVNEQVLLAFAEAVEYLRTNLKMSISSEFVYWHKTPLRSTYKSPELHS